LHCTAYLGLGEFQWFGVVFVRFRNDEVRRRRVRVSAGAGVGRGGVGGGGAGVGRRAEEVDDGVEEADRPVIKVGAEGVVRRVDDTLVDHLADAVEGRGQEPRQPRLLRFLSKLKNFLTFLSSTRVKRVRFQSSLGQQ